MDKWWMHAVVYQIYPKSFNDSNGDGIGDLQGIIQKLDYIRELGADTIWLNPIYVSPDIDNGYDIADYYRINPQYGTLEDFKELLDQVHSRDMRLIMDMVLNHTSDEHPWFQRSRASKENPYRDYYFWRPGKDGKEPNNWGNYFYEGSAWEYDQATDEYYLHNYSYKMPDLNWDNPKVFDDMCRMMQWWLDMGVDGFRMDAVNRMKKPEGLPDSPNPPTPPVGIHGYVVDRTMCANQPGIHELLHRIYERVWSKYDILVVGETGNVDSSIASSYVCRDYPQLDMVFHFELAKNPVLPTVNDVKDVQRRWYEVLKNNGWISQYLSNHDTPRQVSRFADDRQYRYESATMLAMLIHTWPGTPYIYQGEEIGMTNVDFPSISYYNEKYTIGKYQTMVEAGKDPKEALDSLKMMSRDNARTPMQWDSSENAGFTTATPWLSVNPRYPEINAQKDMAAPRSVYRFYQALIRLRRESQLLVHGDYVPMELGDENIIAHRRSLGADTMTVIANYSGGTVSLELPKGLGVCVLYNYEDCDGATLRPYEARLYISYSNRGNDLKNSKEEKQ